MTLSTDFKTGYTTEYNGKQVKVVDFDIRGYITIEDNQGNRSSIRISDLKNTPLFNLNSDKAIKERKERIENFQNLADIARTEKNSWQSKIKDLGAQLSGLNKNDEFYGIIKKKYWAARFERVAYSNEEQRYLLDAFLATLEKPYWFT